ncbi:MAG: zinc ribbon domain-containing protein [Sulfurihydrogenibium sp.]
MDSITARNLLKLQDIDLKIEEVKAKIEKIPAEIKKIEEEKQKIIDEFENILRQRKQLEITKKEKELDIQTFQDRIKKIEERLNTVRNNDEYKALLREKAQAEEAIIHIEDEILKIMEDLENLQSRIKELEKEKDLKIQTLENQIHEKKQEIENLNLELKELQQKREELTKQIKPQDLAQYENIKKKVKTKVIAVVDDQVCTGCYMVIPPKVFTELLKSENLLRCPNCGRYLFYEAK